MTPVGAVASCPILAAEPTSVARTPACSWQRRCRCSVRCPGSAHRPDPSPGARCPVDRYLARGRVDCQALGDPKNEHAGGHPSPPTTGHPRRTLVRPDDARQLTNAVAFIRPADQTPLDTASPSRTARL